jgi:hypothetical protein
MATRQAQIIENLQSIQQQGGTYQDAVNYLKSLNENPSDYIDSPNQNQTQSVQQAQQPEGLLANLNALNQNPGQYVQQKLSDPNSLISKTVTGISDAANSPIGRAAISVSKTPLKIAKAIGTPILDVLDVIARPGYAATNTIYNLTKGQSITNEDIQKQVEAGQNLEMDIDLRKAATNISNFIKKGAPIAANSITSGLTGEQKKTVGDILTREFGVPQTLLGKIGLFSAGLAGDIFVDPLRQVSLPIKAGEKVLRAGEEAVTIAKAKRYEGVSDSKHFLSLFNKEVQFSENIVNPIFEKATDAENYLRENAPLISNALDKIKYVDTKFKPKGVNMEEWEGLIKARTTAKNIGQSMSYNAVHTAKELKTQLESEGIRAGTAEMDNLVGMIESNQAIDSLAGQRAIQFSTDLQDLYKNVGQTGKNIIEQDGYRYLPHIAGKLPTDLKKSLGLGARQFTTRSVSDISRDWVKYTNSDGEWSLLNLASGKMVQNGKTAGSLDLQDINELKKNFNIELPLGKIEQITIPEANQAAGTTLFSTNLPKLLAVQGMRTAKVVEGDTFFTEMRKFGELPKLVDGVKTPPVNRLGIEYTQSSAPELKGLYFDPEIAKHIDTYYTKLTNPKDLHIFWQGYDKLQNAWKTMSTVWWVPFHTRNGVNNMFQNSLMGVNDPFYYLKAASMQIQDKFPNFHKYLEDKMPSVFKPFSDADLQILKEYRDQGLEKVGFMSGDIESLDNLVMAPFDSIKGAPTFKDKAGRTFSYVSSLPTKLGRFASELVEGNAKLAHFIAKRADGFSSYDAGKSVKKALFDYDDLTDIEKGVLKRAMPFYTYTKKNVPLQFEALLKTPAKQLKVVKIKNNIELLTGDDNTEVLLKETHPEIYNAAPVFIGRKDGKDRYVTLGGYIGVSDLNMLSNPSSGVTQLLSMVTPLAKLPVEQAINQWIYFGKPITKQVGFKVIPYGSALSKVPGTEVITGYGEDDLLGYRVPGRLAHLATLFRPINELNKIVGTQFKDRSTADKVMNILLGGKTYDYNVRDLLKQYQGIEENKIRDIEREVYSLEQQIRKYPNQRETIIGEIQTLQEFQKIQSQKSRQNLMKAYQSIR